MSGIAFRRRSLQSRLGVGQVDPMRCSSAALVWARHFDAKCATAHRAHTQGWPLRTLLVLKDNKGFGQRQARGATTTAHLHFFHRCILGVCTNIAACRYRGASREATRSAISRTSLNGNLEAVAFGAPKPKAKSTACCKPGIGVQQDMDRVSCIECS